MRCDLLATGLGLLLLACSRSTSVPVERDERLPSAPPLASGVPASGVPARLDAHELTWVYPETRVGPMHVVVVVPARRRADERFPVLIAMHGRGEALKGPAAGARGWVDDYGLPRALRRLAEPPLTRNDFLGMVEPDRLDLLNATIARNPYAGVVVVCPYTPDILAGEHAFEQAAPLAEFLVDELVPRVLRETPALSGARHLGVDGVSLGGRAALLVGLQRPAAFGVIGTLQPAFDEREVSLLAARARRAVALHPELRFRLVTSANDYYLASTRALAQELRAVGVEPRLLVLAGNHSYDFNRGPGVLEMLLFHDRALRGLE